MAPAALKEQEHLRKSSKATVADLPQSLRDSKARVYASRTDGRRTERGEVCFSSPSLRFQFGTPPCRDADLATVADGRALFAAHPGANGEHADTEPLGGLAEGE